VLKTDETHRVIHPAAVSACEVHVVAQDGICCATTELVLRQKSKLNIIADARCQGLRNDRSGINCIGLAVGSDSLRRLKYARSTELASATALYE